MSIIILSMPMVMMIMTTVLIMMLQEHKNIIITIMHKTCSNIFQLIDATSNLPLIKTGYTYFFE